MGAELTCCAGPRGGADKTFRQLFNPALGPLTRDEMRVRELLRDAVAAPSIGAFEVRCWRPMHHFNPPMARRGPRWRWRGRWPVTDPAASPQNALDEARALGAERPARSLLMCRCRGNLASLHEQQGHVEEAMEQYSCVVAECREHVGEGAWTRRELACRLAIIRLQDAAGRAKDATSSRAHLQDRLLQLEAQGFSPDVLSRVRGAMEHQELFHAPDSPGGAVPLRTST